jgi:hypothetical protein
LTPTTSDSAKLSTPPAATPPLSCTLQLNVPVPPDEPASGLNFMFCNWASV